MSPRPLRLVLWRRCTLRDDRPRHRHPVRFRTHTGELEFRKLRLIPVPSIFFSISSRSFSFFLICSILNSGFLARSESRFSSSWLGFMIPRELRTPVMMMDKTICQDGYVSPDKLQSKANISTSTHNFHVLIILSVPLLRSQVSPPAFHRGNNAIDALKFTFILCLFETKRLIYLVSNKRKFPFMK